LLKWNNCFYILFKRKIRLNHGKVINRPPECARIYELY